eukprot:s117_g6.t1
MLRYDVVQVTSTTLLMLRYDVVQVISTTMLRYDVVQVTSTTLLMLRYDVFQVTSTTLLMLRYDIVFLQGVHVFSEERRVQERERLGSREAALKLGQVDQRCHRTLWLAVADVVLVDIPPGQERLRVLLDHESEARWIATDQLESDIVPGNGRVGKSQWRLGCWMFIV